MVFTLDTDLPPALAPLAWLIGRWEGAGVVGYPTIESKQFGQEIVCSHDGRPFLEWHSHTWLLDEDGQKVRPLATELGFWRPLEAQPDGTNVEFLLAHPTGFVEMYAGKAEPAKVEVRTDGVMRSPAAKEYTAAHRLYGLVNSNLMWVMDMAAMGQPLQSHVSAELKRVE
ncbi:MAG TPA: FABP family protein [Phycicoccus elongatus]|uniref:Peroxynitrite isomerase n=1 Tax=Phycicoccus elongatus Lp2 TaxID=1193181 RepID=N0DZX6_9MICO|nr:MULTISPECIES: FABP family protein [Phycicoccus]MBK8728812.1 FABP family protein [Tetrasphaera sp.]MCA0321698.1 FABP family protein [Actinomycetota bacterium]MCB1238666.1 FABP family protein [Tetrasphaera sp.]MCB9406961.1 FABP family protein [Tetrasphaera sp.]MCO5302939.1 FABP family protein [Phycicoccus sp.]